VSVVAMKLRNWSRAKGTQEGRDVKIDIRQTTLFPLSQMTNTNRNTYTPPWEWVEASVWTPRMLAALETNGVRGGKWHSLIDKVYALPNLRAAWTEVRANKGAAGVDHQTIEHCERDLEANLERLAEQLRDGSYVPQAVRRVWIPKPGSREGRPLGIPTVRDRVVQTALRNVLEPIFEVGFAAHSYGFRPGRGCQDALRRVEQLLEAGHTFVVDADLKSYFDTIPHEKMRARVGTKIADGRVLELLDAFLNQEVMSTHGAATPEAGTPQGAVISPLLSNIYLDPLDHLMVAQGWEMVRYADDFVILCRSQAEAAAALRQVQDWTAKAGLILHPEKTRVVDATQKGGFDFLGYHFERGYKWPRKKSEQKLKDHVREHTRRTNGQSLRAIITQLNPILHGWYEYFQHSHRTTWAPLDGWIRMRLRSILRKRHHGQGRGGGADHWRWPNAYFEAQGLFSFVAAAASKGQSSTR
jgi:RNA-directed DNA polymerase